ncbi:hypothetical protein SBV1_2030014 [Verrucomicrobia bacterium]|nr:hypothetical protein SBV1_2030014 [Verrucomicrobiota bacterium]
MLGNQLVHGLGERNIVLDLGQIKIKACLAATLTGRSACA